MVKNNEYEERISGLLTDYNKAINDINELLGLIQAVIVSLNDASGTDITKMKEDLTNSKNYYDTLKENTRNAKAKYEETAQVFDQWISRCQGDIANDILDKKLAVSQYGLDQGYDQYKVKNMICDADGLIKLEVEEIKYTETYVYTDDEGNQQTVSLLKNIPAGIDEYTTKRNTEKTTKVVKIPEMKEFTGGKLMVDDLASIEGVDYKLNAAQFSDSLITTVNLLPENSLITKEEILYYVSIGQIDEAEATQIVHYVNRVEGLATPEKIDMYSDDGDFSEAQKKTNSILKKVGYPEEEVKGFYDNKMDPENSPLPEESMGAHKNSQLYDKYDQFAATYEQQPSLGDAVTTPTTQTTPTTTDSEKTPTDEDSTENPEEKKEEKTEQPNDGVPKLFGDNDDIIYGQEQQGTIQNLDNMQ